ncbi:U-box domain-containing protein 20 [Nymphaea thermarum]|nr:U-box domain-containing protein 20 [Nymphaea thermarum]
MPLWRIRMGSGRSKSGKTRPPAVDLSDVVIPPAFRCPISLDLMKDPVILSTGITYDRQSIERWLDDGNLVCPVTKQPLQSSELVPNHALLRVIQRWCVDHPSAGIERIPTPRVPASRSQVAEMLSQVEIASRRGSPASFATAVDRIRLLARENERNRRCAVGAGAGAALTAALAAFCERFAEAEGEVEPNAAVEAALAAAAAVMPLDAEACSRVWTRSCIRRLGWVLQGGSLEGRRNATSFLRAVLEDEVEVANNRKILESSPALVEGLARAVREPICPSATKASLTSIFRMASASDQIASRVVDSGLVPVLLETLAECERGVCEKVLAVLDLACACREGRQRACEHALAVPVLVKKVLKVSEATTELAVSVLWRLCKGAKDDAVVTEALSMGVFQKLLLLLQLGCGERTKEKATDLLKMMNAYRDRRDCVDSGDFKEVKRPV